MSVECSDFFVDPELDNPVFAEHSPSKVSEDQHDDTQDYSDSSTEHH